MNKITWYLVREKSQEPPLIVYLNLMWACAGICTLSRSSHAHQTKQVYFLGENLPSILHEQRDVDGGFAQLNIKSYPLSQLLIDLWLSVANRRSYREKYRCSHFFFYIFPYHVKGRHASWTMPLGFYWAFLCLEPTTNRSRLSYLVPEIWGLFFAKNVSPLSLVYPEKRVSDPGDHDQSYVLYVSLDPRCHQEKVEKIRLLGGVTLCSSFKFCGCHPLQSQKRSKERSRLLTRKILHYE